jgi:endonuclease/exonuclease/phosphatase (EEP) superfamily protein YafD
VTRFVATLVIGYSVAMLLLGGYLRVAGDLTPAGMLLAFSPRWILLLPWTALVLLAWWRSKRLATLAVAAAVGTAFGVAGFEVPTPVGRSGPIALRLVTYNTDGSRVLADRIRGDLVLWDADVVLFQDCAATLADSLRAIVGGGLRVSNELCVVSRLPVGEFVPLNSQRGDARRTRAVRLDVETPTGSITVVGVHFVSPRTALNAARLRNFSLLRRSINQRTQTSQEVREWSRTSRYPVVVAGDFNMPDGSAALRRDWGDLRNVFSERGWGFGHTMRIGLFAVRIDHVFTSRSLAPQSVQVLAGYPSEHQPVLVEIGRLVDASSPRQ